MNQACPETGTPDLFLAFTYARIKGAALAIGVGESRDCPMCNRASTAKSRITGCHGLSEPALAATLAPMLVRLTRQNRAKAGWFVALLYLLCVVAPGVALARGNPAPWLPAEIKLAAAAEMHHHSANGASHEH